jgi:hypothetical protein
MLRIGALLLSVLLSACTYVHGDPRVLVTSDPPGAEILVDGEPSGFTTPTMLDLDAFFGDNHLITVRMPGYVDETREVVHRRVWRGSRWIDGVDHRVFPFPFHWTLGDWFTPLEVEYLYVPAEVYVVLWKDGEAPVKLEDALAADPAGDPDAEP